MWFQSTDCILSDASAFASFGSSAWMFIGIFSCSGYNLPAALEYPVNVIRFDVFASWNFSFVHSPSKRSLSLPKQRQEIERRKSLVEYSLHAISFAAYLFFVNTYWSWSVIGSLMVVCFLKSFTFFRSRFTSFSSVFWGKRAKWKITLALGSAAACNSCFNFSIYLLLF